MSVPTSETEDCVSMIPQKPTVHPSHLHLIEIDHGGSKQATPAEDVQSRGKPIQDPGPRERGVHRGHQKSLQETGIEVSP
ncbi:hypothetical protein AGOR_G00109460 [Albula goreensis]|uniref:Uncharacterized protein n=1 Tax=Albula goreensis TaxID=1534307 RepID=A0A8T3DFX0_9TELE|nr:hypothetical protein AGOR_G00109460 [Albula goreensis]